MTKLIRICEERIARKTISALLKAGYRVSVYYDGDDFGIEQSTSRKAIFEAMFAVDECYLFAMLKNGQRKGWVRFIFGNDGWDVINDYTTNLETVLKPVNDYAANLA